MGVNLLNARLDFKGFYEVGCVNSIILRIQESANNKFSECHPIYVENTGKSEKSIVR